MYPPYFRYWGKAQPPSDTEGPRYHLLPYHSLDVAAVAAAWWERSPLIRRSFMLGVSCSEAQLRGWVLFFVALHDIGKFDIRFQFKARNVYAELNTNLNLNSVGLTEDQIRRYPHGSAGLYWMSLELDECSDVDSNVGDGFGFLLDLGIEDTLSDKTLAWLPWLEAVTGHHGHLIKSDNNDIYPLPSACERNPAIVQQDCDARKAWLEKCAELFLAPVGLTLDDIPPEPSSLLAGFCSISDWLGSASSDEHFEYHSAHIDCEAYFKKKCVNDAVRVLEASGLLGQAKPDPSVQKLLNENHAPRQLQTLVDQLPQIPALTLIEAPTGSGKTETALAYAWRLLDAGLADRIVFALPTQATANAMLERVETLATTIFGRSEVVLAHGNARFNKRFIELRERGETAQGSEEAWTECSAWLAQSKKRAFLGQIGICTVDQVLVSVLPVKHRFIRGFGLGQSILIVDEVHAYDSYMYGLLKEVLRRQKAAGGSALMLSATLPAGQRQELASAWDVALPSSNKPEELPYPLVTCCHSDVSCFDLDKQPEHLPPERFVSVEICSLPDMSPDEQLLKRICKAAESGANVAVVVNMVATAQSIYRVLQGTTEAPVNLFHSRFTLNHRRDIESDVLEHFGTDSGEHGRILVATQVVEQSLDVDFDWLITQLCPADLLFQRMGRLHRHEHKNSNRPDSFSCPTCAVLLPIDSDYGGTGTIYKNTRTLWRTEQLLLKPENKTLSFPTAYRNWIERVYSLDAWDGEPDGITQAYEIYSDKVEKIQDMGARLMIRSGENMTPLQDEDDKIQAVTRDGEMSLQIVPCVETESGDRRLLDETLWSALDKNAQPEALALNRVSVPSSWTGGCLDQYTEGVTDEPYWLPMEEMDGVWSLVIGKWLLRYTKEFGMERLDGSAN